MPRPTRAQSNSKLNSWFQKAKFGIGTTRKLLAEKLEPRHLMAAFINEVQFSPLFGDTAKHQYVELRSDGGQLAMDAGTYLVVIRSADGVTELGDIHTIFDLSKQTFGSNGMLVLLESASNFAVDPAARVLKGTDGFSGMPGNIFSADAGTSSKEIRTGSNTFLLVQSNVAPSLTNDIDINDDGVPDGAYLNWTILDGFTVFPWVEKTFIQKAYAPIVFQDKGVGSGMPGATLVTTEDLSYVGRIGQSTGYAPSDWLAGNTSEDGSATWNFRIEDGLHGRPRPRAYAGRHLDHIGGPNWVGSVSGSVFVDLNSDGIQQPGENPVAGARIVSDLTGDGVPDLYAETIEPSDYAVDTDLTNVSYNATLTTAGTDNLPINFAVEVVQATGNLSGQLIFSHVGIGFFNDIRRLRTDFYRPARSISVNAIGDGFTSNTISRLEIFNAANQSLGFVQSNTLAPNQVQRLTMTSDNDDIAWAVAYAEGLASGRFDTLSFVLPEQSTLSDAQGKYFLQPMTPGNYSVSIVPPPNYDQVFPNGATYSIGVTKYESYSDRNFGLLGGLPPVLNDQTFHVSESSTAGSTIASLQFKKGYPSQVLKASITSGDPTGLFSVDPSNGKITLKRTELDYETKKNFTFTIALSDSSNSSLNDSAVIDLIIDDANDAPVVPSATKSLTENSAIGTVITTMTATDQDPVGAGQVAWSIAAGNIGNAFLIDANSGEVRVNDASKVDYETTKTFNLTVRATDQGVPAMSGDGILTISLLNVNEAPALVVQGLLIKENSLAGALLGTASAIDPDANEVLQWQIVGGTGAALFQIAADGKITLNSGASLDYEQTKQYDLIVKVTDSGTLSDTQTFSVTVQDQNDAPVLTSASSFTLKEDAAEGAVVGVVSASDQDVGQQFTFSIAGTASSKFVIDPTSGQIKVANGATFDFETSPTLSLTVKATDNGTPAESVSSEVAVKIGDVNEAPSIPSSDYDIAENSPVGTSLGSLSATDPDSGDKLSYSIVQQTANWLSVDAATGALVVATGATIDFETLNLNTVTVRVTDSGGLKAERSVLIHALDRNDPPTLNAPLQNANAKPQNLFTYNVPASTFIEQDVGDTLRYVFTDGLGFPMPSWLSYNASTRVLSGTPTASNGGPVELKLTAIDSLNASSSTKFTITVEVDQFPWSNPLNRFDTDGSGGKISPVDALIVINFLNSGAPRSILPGAPPTFGFLDTSRDNLISPIDVLLVINELNRLVNGEGEAAPATDDLKDSSELEQYSSWDYLQQIDERKRQEELIELLTIGRSPHH